MRLIDADELIERAYRERLDSRELIALMIESAPTVEPKHGHWIIRDIPGTYFYQITCSECSEDVTSSAPCIGFLPNAKVLWDYCPYCGAKMDEAAT